MKLCAVGTGSITKSMLKEFSRSDTLRCTSIYSRKEETGRALDTTRQVVAVLEAARKDGSLGF